MAIYVQVGNDVVEFPDGMSDEQIAQAISGSMPQAKAPSSGFLMGLKDPITAGAQLLPRALAGITSLGGTTPNPVSQFFSEEAKRVDEMARAEEQAYQAQRESQGSTGFDVARLGGNILNPASLVPAARVAQLAKAKGLSTVGQAATTESKLFLGVGAGASTFLDSRFFGSSTASSSVTGIALTTGLGASSLGLPETSAWYGVMVTIFCTSGLAEATLVTAWIALLMYRKGVNKIDWLSLSSLKLNSVTT